MTYAKKKENYISMNKNSFKKQENITTELAVCNKKTINLGRSKNKRNTKPLLKKIGISENESMLLHKKKYDFGKRKIWFWETLNKTLLKTSYGSEFLLGGSSENTNDIWRSNFLMSKNNIEIFNTFSVRMRLLALYASFKWFRSAFMFEGVCEKFKLMFASHTPVFSNLMTWAGAITNGVGCGNRWLPGKISAQTNLKFLPNYLFIPDPDENLMIMKEAWCKKIPVISINGSDSKFVADLGVYGNNKSFKLIFKLLQLIIRFSKRASKKNNVLSQKTTTKKNKNWFVLSSQKL